MLRRSILGVRGSIFSRKYSSLRNFIPALQMEPPAASLPAPERVHKRNRPRADNRIAKRRKIQSKPVKEGSNEEVLLADIRRLLAAHTITEALTDAETPTDVEAQPATSNQLPEPFTEIEVEVSEISSTGDGLATFGPSPQIYVVPFTAPGDKVKIKVIKHFAEGYTLADFVEVIEPSPLRDDTRIKCQYFSKCSGCQFQMLDYEEQLKHKTKIVEKAYINFSGLSPTVVPAVANTIGSPLEYGYRTKLTPHFDGPPGSRRRGDRNQSKRAVFEEVPPIGFMLKGLRKTLDIEDCPIGTDAVRMGMKSERKRVAEELNTYARGATLLLRESTKRIPKHSDIGSETPEIITNSESPVDIIRVEYPAYTDEKTCITDQNAISMEYVDSYAFANPAGSFFQNNNSILPVFTSYIRSHILPPSQHKIKYLIDAYSGSGLFTITLSSLFERSIGIDISRPSISFASRNADLNGISSDKASFIAADAPELFKSITFPSNETAVVIDPPRKGCDESFLRQLLEFGPTRVVYVSCNVHTQARDVGILVNGLEGQDGLYDIESLQGFDFFPQTGHVEGVAVLQKRGINPTETDDASGDSVANIIQV